MAGTDHKAVVTEFQKGEFKRGPSTWKFNTSYLKESAFVQQINACISKSPEESEREDLDGSTTWELLKATIRSECMLYSGNKDNETNKPSRFTLERELTHLSALISRSPTDHSLITNCENCTKKLEIAELARTKGAIVRSRIK